MGVDNVTLPLMQNHEIVAELSDASKSTDVLDLKSEEEKMLRHDEIKEEVSKEVDLPLQSFEYLSSISFLPFFMKLTPHLCCSYMKRQRMLKYATLRT